MDKKFIYTPDQESAEKVFYESLKPLMDNNYHGIEKEKEIERLKSEKEKEKIVDYFQTGKNNNFDFTEGMHNMSNKEDSDDDNDYFRFSKKETPEEGAKLEEKKQGLVIDDDLNLSDERARRAYVALVDRFSQLPQTRSRANQMAKMVLAQAALETGSWTSAASQVNNLSGIKYYGQSGRVASNVLAPAAEEKGYRRPYVQYDSPEDWANDMVNTLVKLYPQTLTANTVDEYAKGLVGKNYKYYGTDPSVYAKGMKAKLRTMIDPKKSYEKLSSAFEQSVNEYKEKYPNRPVPVINSGLRTTAEQQALYNNRANNPYPVAAPGTSEHEYGRAIDVGFNGAHTDQDYRNFAEIMGTHGVNWLADKDKVHFQLAEFGNGGIIDDDMGQWAHPGEVTRINSRNITMNGVSYPVLGVGANGEQILMHPEQNYIFEQGPVTEYPMKRRGRLKKAKDGGLTQYQDGTTNVEPIIKNQEEFLKNWYENRAIPVPFIQEAYDLDKPGYVQKVSNFPSITYVEKVPTPGNSGTPSSNGRVTGQYNQTANTVYITPYAQPSVPVHEFTHYIDRLPEGTYMNNIHKEIISREILPQSEVPEQYKAKYSYYTDPEEVHARIMVLRQRAGFKPDEVITKEKLEDFLKNYNGDDENINDILSLSKGIFGLSNLLNYMAVNDSEDNGVRHAKYGGRLSKYQSGSTVSEDDTKYAQFVQTLPNNLKPQNTPDDALYNLRGYWESLGKPSEFDYNQPKESDGYYHAYSRNPNTGEILKKPGHPTFIQALQEDEHVGYYPFVSPDGTIYTFGKHDIIPDGFKMYEYKRGGVTWLNEYQNAGSTIPVQMPDGSTKMMTQQQVDALYDEGHISDRGPNGSYIYKNLPQVNVSAPRMTQGEYLMKDLKDAGNWIEQSLLNSAPASPVQFKNPNYTSEEAGQVLPMGVIAGAAAAAPFILEAAAPYLAEPIINASLTGAGAYMGANKGIDAYKNYKQGRWYQGSKDLAEAALLAGPGVYSAAEEVSPFVKRMLSPKVTNTILPTNSNGLKEFPSEGGIFPNVNEIGDFEFKPFSQAWWDEQAMREAANAPHGILTKDDFYTLDELEKYKEFEDKWNHFANNLEDRNMTLSEAREIFAEQNPELTEFAENFLKNKKNVLPEYEAQVWGDEGVRFRHADPPNNTVEEKGGIDAFKTNHLKELNDPNSWLNSGDAKDVLAEMTGFSSEELANLSFEELENMRRELIKNLRTKEELKLQKIITPDPNWMKKFTTTAYGNLTQHRNKYGGPITGPNKLKRSSSFKK